MKQKYRYRNFPLVTYENTEMGTRWFLGTLEEEIIRILKVNFIVTQPKSSETPAPFGNKK